jgi:hypothetical protein
MSVFDLERMRSIKKAIKYKVAELKENLRF